MEAFDCEESEEHPFMSQPGITSLVLRSITCCNGKAGLEYCLGKVLFQSQISM